MATIQPLPDHIPLASEAPAHVVQKIANDGTLMVKDAVTGDMRQMRLGVAEVSGERTIVAVGDP